MVEASYERAKAVHAVTNFGIDDVVDPATTRTWITAGVRSLPPEMEPAGCGALRNYYPHKTDAELWSEWCAHPCRYSPIGRL